VGASRPKTAAVSVGRGFESKEEDREGRVRDRVTVWNFGPVKKKWRQTARTYNGEVDVKSGLSGIPLQQGREETLRREGNRNDPGAAQKKYPYWVSFLFKEKGGTKWSGMYADNLLTRTGALNKR